jgi:hypothetical protein
MTFQEALVQMQEGKIVSLRGNRYFVGDALVIYFTETGDIEDDNATVAELGINDYTSTEWQVVNVLPTLTEGQAYMYFDPEKNRWVSTTNPQRHIDNGHRVAIFALNRAV